MNRDDEVRLVPLRASEAEQLRLIGVMDAGDAEYLDWIADRYEGGINNAQIDHILKGGQGLIREWIGNKLRVALDD